MRRHVREARDEIALEASARRGIFGRPQNADAGLRRVGKRTRAEDEHEPAVACVLPLDVADAGYAGLDHATEHVEPDEVADVDVEPLVNAALHGDLGRPCVLGHRRLARPELAVHDLLIGFQMIAVSDHVLPCQRASRAHVLHVREIDVATSNTSHPGAQDRNQPRRTCARGLMLLKEGPHLVNLLRQDLDQEHVRSAGRHLERETAEGDCASSVRTPITKKLPRPTASRITRV